MFFSMDFAIKTFIFRGFSHGFCHEQLHFSEAENVAAAQSLGFQGLLYDARKAAQGDLAKAGHVEISWDIMGFLSHHDLRYIIYIYI